MLVRAPARTVAAALAEPWLLRDSLARSGLRLGRVIVDQFAEGDECTATVLRVPVRLRVVRCSSGTPGPSSSTSSRAPEPAVGSTNTVIWARACRAALRNRLSSTSSSSPDPAHTGDAMAGTRNRTDGPSAGNLPTAACAASARSTGPAAGSSPASDLDSTSRSSINEDSRSDSATTSVSTSCANSASGCSTAT